MHFFQLVRLVTLREFRDASLGDALTEAEWDAVEEIISVLEPFNKYSKKLQSENATLSDFFGYWTLLRIKVSKSYDQLSQELLTQMNRYHNVLIENPALIGAVFLDPRYQRGLGSKIELAVDFLADLYDKITKVEAADNETNSVESEKENSNSGSENKDDSYDDLNEYLDACNSAYSALSSISSSALNPKEMIKKILNDFIGEELPLTASILPYWNAKIETNPELYKLASVLMAIPPTQTTVERVFSALALVLTPHRTRLGDETLENILLVRLNHDLLINNN